MSLSLYYYTAPWCIPCGTLLPRARELAERFGVARFEVVDIERDPGLVPDAVLGVPTIILQKGGGLADILSPARASLPGLRAALKKVAE